MIMFGIPAVSDMHAEARKKQSKKQSDTWAFGYQGLFEHIKSSFEIWNHHLEGASNKTNVSQVVG